MSAAGDSTDKLLLVALGHPVRRDILKRMAGEESISPRGLSNGMKGPLSNIAYHVRVLAECEAIALVSTKPVRGSMQHFYRFAIEAPWACEVLEVTPPSSSTG